MLLSQDETAVRILKDLQEFLMALAYDPGEAAYGPADNSRAVHERSSMPPDLDPINAFYQAGILHEVAVDNAYAFTKLFTPYVPSIAPWNLTRAVLETSAISSWLTDPEIAAAQRSARSICLRIEGVRQQLALSRTGYPDVNTTRLDQAMAELRAKLDLANAHLLASSSSPSSKAIKGMPITTDLVRDVLGFESDYRILSAIVHAHQWALSQSSFAVKRDEAGPSLQRRIEPVGVIYMCKLCASAIVHSLIRISSLGNWKEPQMASAISKGKRIANVTAKMEFEQY